MKNSNNLPVSILLLFIVAFCAKPSLQSFVILSSNGSTLFDEKCHNFKFLGPDMKGTINASYVAADPWDACSSLHNKEQYEGKIVVFDYWGCLPSEKAKHIQNAGGILGAMLIDSESIDGLANARYDGSSGIRIPLVIIVPSSEERHDWIQNTAQSISLDKSTDPAAYFAIVTPDPLESVTDFWVFFSVIIGVYSLINVSLGSLRLYQILCQQGKFEASLPEICLVMEVGANLARIVMCIDPDYGTGWGIYPFSTNIVLQFFSFPWTFAATALIGAYWNRALNHFVQNTHESTNVFSIEKWKIPIAVLCFFLIVWGIINAGLQAYFIVGHWEDVGEIIYIVVCIGVSIYFLVTGTRIILVMRKTSAVTKSSERMKKIAILVGVSGFGIALMFVGLICVAIDENLWMIYSFFSFVGLNTMGLAKVIIFEATQKAPSSNTKTPTDTHRSIQLPEISIQTE